MLIEGELLRVEELLLREGVLTLREDELDTELLLERTLRDELDTVEREDVLGVAERDMVVPRLPRTAVGAVSRPVREDTPRWDETMPRVPLREDSVEPERPARGLVVVR